MGPAREVWALEGGLSLEWRSGSGAGHLGHGLVVWTTLEVWTLIKD